MRLSAARERGQHHAITRQHQQQQQQARCRKANERKGKNITRMFFFSCLFSLFLSCSFYLPLRYGSYGWAGSRLGRNQAHSKAIHTHTRTYTHTLIVVTDPKRSFNPTKRPTQHHQWWKIYTMHDMMNTSNCHSQSHPHFSSFSYFINFLFHALWFTVRHQFGVSYYLPMWVSSCGWKTYNKNARTNELWVARWCSAAVAALNTFTYYIHIIYLGRHYMGVHCTLCSRWRSPALLLHRNWVSMPTGWNMTTVAAAKTDKAENIIPLTDTGICDVLFLLLLLLLFLSWVLNVGRFLCRTLSYIFLCAPHRTWLTHTTANVEKYTLTHMELFLCVFRPTSAHTYRFGDYAMHNTAR